MRIAIATSGRFHVLDLARELAALGHDVRFYSLVPPSRARAFGLAHESQRCQLVGVGLLAAAARWGPKAWRSSLNRRLTEALDERIARRLEPCDVFIGMSGLCVASAAAARRLGARVYIERGSRHIRSQQRILDVIADATGGGLRVSTWDVERELASYALADRIVVPARHAAQSFVDEGMDAERLFCNPFGVDVDRFKPDASAPTPEWDMLFVGRWELQKGVDLVEAALDELPNLTLAIVGPPGDRPRPRGARVFAFDAVDQRELPRFYRRARTLVLPSRQEGMSLVLVQALACGLGIVCSDRSGGADLRELIPDPSRVRVVPHDDLTALVEALRASAADGISIDGAAAQWRGVSTSLSWAAYARRYERELVQSVRAA